MSFDMLREILLDLGIDEERISESAHLRKDLELDSTETVEMALELKRRFGVEVKLEARKDFTLSEVGAMIDHAKAANI